MPKFIYRLLLVFRNINQLLGCHSSSICTLRLLFSPLVFGFALKTSTTKESLVSLVDFFLLKPSLVFQIKYETEIRPFTSFLVILYAVTAVYFAGVMVRLMLTLTPVVCVLAGIAFSHTYEKFMVDDTDNPRKNGEQKDDKSGMFFY